MELLIGLFVVTYWACAAPRAIADAVATWRASKAGEFDFIDKDRDRREARRGRWAQAWRNTRARRHRQAGGDGNYRPGAAAYLGDVYHGFWEDQLKKRETKRDARGPYVYDPDAPSFRDRLAEAVRDKVDRLRQKRMPESVRRVGRALWEPVGEQPQGRRRATDRLFDDEPFDPPAPEPSAPTPPSSSAHDTTEHQPDVDDQPADQRNQGATTMNTHGGDGLNYDAIVAEHERALNSLRQQLDQAIAVDNHMTATLAAIEGMDSARDSMATATSALTEGMEARRLDGPSLEGAATAAHALTASTVATTQEQIEAAQQQNQRWKQCLEESVAAVEASLNHVKVQYGEAAAVVQETGVDARVLESA